VPVPGPTSRPSAIPRPRRRFARCIARVSDAPTNTGWRKTACGGSIGDSSTAIGRSALASATYAEPPLAPSPYGGYGNDYAYAAAQDVGYGAAPGVIVINNNIGSVGRPACSCGPAVRPSPVVYRYGVGTAY
jgi:hypothetical protein